MPGIIDFEKTAFAVAHNQVGARLPISELIQDLDVTEREFASLLDDALFQRKVREYVTELKANGTSFAVKAAVQAEELLMTQFRIANDPDTPPSVAVAAIANTVRWAGLEKKAGGEVDNASNGPRISVSINLAPPREPTTIDVTPTVTIEQTPAQSE